MLFNFTSVFKELRRVTQPNYHVWEHSKYLVRVINQQTYPSTIIPLFLFFCIFFENYHIFLQKKRL